MKPETGIVHGKIRVDRQLTAKQKLAAARERQEEEKGRPRNVAESDPMDLILDDSSSMKWNSSPKDSTPRFRYLQQAVESFAGEINFLVTPSVYMRPFNAYGLALTKNAEVVNWIKNIYNASGGTPMDKAIAGLNESTSRRGILISDGEADNPTSAIDMAKQSAEKEKVIDCIHISDSEDGEKTLKTIAELTGGMFFKFADMESFKKSLHMLAPKRRSALASASKAERLRLTGATEVS